MHILKSYYPPIEFIVSKTSLNSTYIHLLTATLGLYFDVTVRTNKIINYMIILRNKKFTAPTDLEIEAVRQQKIEESAPSINSDMKKAVENIDQF